jgi:hypothetical protein
MAHEPTETTLAKAEVNAKELKRGSGIPDADRRRLIRTLVVSATVIPIAAVLLGSQDKKQKPQAKKKKNPSWQTDNTLGT